MTKSTEERNASAKGGGLADTKVALTAEGAGVVADSIRITHSTEGMGGGMAVTRILKSDLQHFLEREGIAFINVRHKVAVGALMARRLREMEAHECSECVNLGERQRLDSRKLSERFVKESHVLGELLRGVISERHALLKTVHDKLVGDSSACTRKHSKQPFPGKGTTSGCCVIVRGEHGEKGAERFSGGFERLPKPVLDDGFGTKDIRGEKRLAHHSVKFLFLGGESGPFDHRKLDESGKTLA